VGETCRVVRYDCRGTGLSDRDHIDFGTDAQARDLAAVADHYGLASFALWGSIGGSPAAIRYASRNPERVSHLFLWGAFLRGEKLFRRATGAMGPLLREDWEMYSDTYAQTAFGWPDAPTAARYAALMRAAITQEAAIACMRSLANADVRADAPRIACPALILARRDAKFDGVENAQALAAAIPGSRMLVMEGSSPAPFLGDWEAVVRAIVEFMGVQAAAPRRFAGAALTDRERQVLRLLAGGSTAKQIGAALGVSVATVQRHIANIYTKIGARGRVDAAAYAFENGLAPRRA
jgi:pimeloyl-ACP methyl ester carboxylesterase/DNA-binding CsgD family transcriptional regulator